MTLSSLDRRMVWCGAKLRKGDIAFHLTRRHATTLEEL